MLEKIGLPPKPSLRGNSWVVDASHCQGCASQFTFINRKHHCRRCGGIFCGSCTQQRMVLRGQGDSPVRICEPCKKLEEAARFEMRQGYKSRSAKGSSKLGSKKEDENEAKLLSKQITGSASSSSIQRTGGQSEEDDIVRNFSLDQPTMEDVGSATPDELREQALLEKQKYRTLKAEGKSEEALRAFKRGKELERQAGALEISLRKLRKRALSTTNLDDAQGAKASNRASTEKNKLSSDKSTGKEDLSAELRELGWSDADLRDAEKKPATLTVEGELFSLLREVSQKPSKEKQSINTDKSKVLAHKKKALELKRAGNLMEAKEELKRAKILERKIEEEELLGEADDSDDDELSSLMRSLDSDKHDDLSSNYKSDINFDFNQFAGIGDDFDVDGNFDVTEDDMADPEMASALKSLGWDVDASDPEDIHIPAPSSSRESLLSEIQSLKREAVNQKRAGNASEAMVLLKKAKVLEMDVSTSEALDSDFKDSITAKKTSSLGDDYGNHKSASKSKLTVQKELIAMKKKALTLRREGRLDESEEELRKAKALEQQLEEMNAAAPPPVVTQTSASHSGKTSSAIMDSEDVEEEVTDQDLNDPSYLSLLKNLGWDEEDVAKAPSATYKENEVAPSNDDVSKEDINFFDAQNVEAGMSRKTRSEIQRELLALKRKALNLRRQGDVEAADEVLNNARSLEAQLQEYDKPMAQSHVSSEDSGRNASIDAPQHSKSSPEMGELKKQDKVGLEKPEETRAADSSPHKLDNHASNTSQAMDSSPQQEILAHKRKAISLKREGKLAEAKEELRLAKLLEKRVEEEDKGETSRNSIHAATPVSDVSSSEKKEANPSPPKLLTSRERFKLQQESLHHKRQALKLRREGKTAEADAEFELAKSIEAQLQESDDTSKTGEATDDVSVEDFLDPQLLSALQSIGIQEVRPTSAPTPTPTPIPTSQGRSAAKSNGSDGGDDMDVERKQLTERIKAEKVKAVNFKRSGKQAEALDALRRAKLYEKKLQSLNPK